MRDERKLQEAMDWYTQEFWHPTLEGGAHHRDSLFTRKLMDAGLSEVEAAEQFEVRHTQLIEEWNRRVGYQS